MESHSHWGAPEEKRKRGKENVFMTKAGAGQSCCIINQRLHYHWETHIIYSIFQAIGMCTWAAHFKYRIPECYTSAKDQVRELQFNKAGVRSESKVKHPSWTQGITHQSSGWRSSNHCLTGYRNSHDNDGTPKRQTNTAINNSVHYRGGDHGGLECTSRTA